MLRAPALMLVLGCAVGVSATAHAGEKEKVHTLSAGNLKIDGKLAEDGPKVSLTHPGDGSSKELLAKVFMVRLGAGRYQIDLGSDDIDCVLAVQDKTGKQLAFDDDSGAGNTGLNSRLVFQAKDDTYKIVAASFNNDAGPFTLTIKQLGGAGGNKGGDQGGAAGGDATKPIEGEVDQSAPKVRIVLPGGQNVTLPAKMHEIKLEGGTKYQFDAIAKDQLDPVLVVQDAAGKQIGFDDDGGGKLNSRLTLEIANAGAHKVFVAALAHPDGSHGEGKYTLTIKRLGAGAGGAKQGDGKAAKPIKLEGSVSPNDERVPITNAAVDMKLGLIPGKQTVRFPAKLHEVELESGSYKVEATAVDMVDPILVVQDSAGKQLAFDDDGAGFPNSRLTFQAAKAGAYKIYVGTIGGQGKYTLTVTQADGKDPKGGAKVDDPKGGQVFDVGVRGVRLNGALGAQTKSISYRVKLEQGKSYVIEMQAANQDQLDPFVEVHSAAGERLAHDDDGAGDLNARLVFRAPASAVYTVVARSFGNSGVGDFTLSVKQQDE